MKLNLILIGILIIVSLFFLRQCNITKQYSAKDKQNSEALEGLKEIRLKNNQLVAERALFTKSLTELKQNNVLLYDQVKQLNKEGGKVKIIYQTRVEYESPRIELDNKIVDLSENWKGLLFNHKTEYSHISGMSTFKLFYENENLKILPGKTIIDTNYTSLSLIYGLRKVNGVDRVFATSTNPNIRISDIEGYEITGKNNTFINNGYSKINLGFNLGVGLLYTKEKVIFGPTLSVGVNYNLLKRK